MTVLFYPIFGSYWKEVRSADVSWEGADYVKKPLYLAGRHVFHCHTSNIHIHIRLS